MPSVPFNDLLHYNYTNVWYAVNEKQDAAECRALEAERAERCWRRCQREEEAENWDPEHDDLGADGPDDE